MDSGRYNKTYTYGTVQFSLDFYTPNIEEYRFLILKVVEQAVRDYLLLSSSELPSDIYLWKTAESFIFDSEHMIMWGDLELTLEDLLNVIDIDVDWFREKVTKRFQQKHGENNGQEEEGRGRDSRAR